MATTTNLTTTYAGKAAGEIFRATFLEGRTLGDELITFKPNIEYKEVVRRGTSTGIIKDASCDFDATGTVTLDERTLTPKELEVNLEFCKKTFESDWAAVEMGVSAWKNPPSSIVEFVMSEIMESIAEATEDSIWQGDAGNTGEFDGFTKLFAADSNVIDVDSGVITLNASNILTEARKVIAACPKKVLTHRRTDLHLYMGTSAFLAYEQALGGFGANGLGANGYRGEGPNQEFSRVLLLDGIKVVEAPGIPDNQMVLARKSNLWFGTGLLSDYNEIRMKDMVDVDLSQNFRFAAQWKAAVQYGFGGEIVYYWNAP